MHQGIGEKLKRGESVSSFTTLDCWSSGSDSRGQGLLHGSSLHTMVLGAKSQSLSKEHHSFFLLVCAYDCGRPGLCLCSVPDIFKVILSLWFVYPVLLIPNWLSLCLHNQATFDVLVLSVYLTIRHFLIGTLCFQLPSFVDLSILPFFISFSLSSLLLLPTQTSKYPSWHLSTHASIYPPSNHSPSSHLPTSLPVPPLAHP